MIRPFDHSQHDYEQFVSLQNVTSPDFHSTVAELQEADKKRNPKHKRVRYLLEKNGRMVAGATYQQFPWAYHPHKFNLHVFVADELRNQGIGQRLYAHLLAEIKAFEPKVLTGVLREDSAESVSFIEKRGFQVVQRNINCQLQVDGFEAGPFAAAEARFAAAGLTIKTLTQLREQDPDYQRKVYELEMTLADDVPTPDEHTWDAFEDYQRIFTNPRMLPDGMIFACDGDDLVGMTELWKSTPDNAETLHQGMTGTLGTHRRKGAATVLKLRGIEFAQSIKAKLIKTDNEQNNPMYLINQAMGFAETPAQLIYMKKLR